MDKPPGQTELRILLLEDVPTDAELMENALREAGLFFTTKRVDTRETFIRALEEFKPDIVLADYKLPAFDGASALKIVRQQYPTVPVVMVTGAMGDEKAIELLKLGARDYVLKDRLVQLGSAVQRALSVEHGIRARKAAEQALRQSEADLRTLVERSPIAMLVDVGVDADEKIVMMNQKFTELFGYTMADVPDTHHWWPLAYPDEAYREELRAEWTRRVEKAIQSHGDIEPMEATVTCKKGLRRYIRISLASIGNRNIITFEDLTERKQAQEELERFFNLIPDLVCVASTDGYFLKINPAWQETLGYTIQEILSKPFLDFVHPDDRAATIKELDRQLSGEATVQFSNRYCCKDGSYKWLEWKTTPAVDGKLLFASARDITEHKIAEERIRFSEALLRQTQSLAAIGSWRLYVPRNELVWSDETYRLFGIPVGTPLRYEAFIGYVHPDDRAMVDSAWQAALKGAPYFVQHRIVVNGATRWVEEHAELEFDAQGNLNSGMGAVQDITERKQAENTLRLHSEILRNLSEGIIMIRASDGVIVFTNPQFERLFGYEPDELLGKHVSILNAPDEKSPEAVAAAIIGELVQAGKWSGEVHNIKKDGTTFWCYASASSFDHSQFGKAWVTVHEDITERKLAGMRIQKLTRLYATLSQTNGTIVRATNREELLCSICKTAVTHGKFAMAWWGLMDEMTHMVKPLCHSGAENGYLTDIAVSADDVPAGRGPTGTAIRENRISYVNDYATNERTMPWREAALKHGFRGAAGLPLRFKGKVIGALTLYTDEPDFFDTDQMNLLEEMATDISFALDGFEREAQRQQAEGERETALHKLRKALEGSIQIAASISETRDPYTAGHQQRVGQLAEAIAVEMGLSQAQAEGIRFGSMIHDIGKIGVPAEILSKPSRLTPLELQLVQTHARSGYEIVKGIEFPWPVAQMILQHHERLDGSGYPAGLKGNDILLEARVIAVADTVEAMSSHRPYRPGLGMDAALTEITGASGVRYDQQAVEACLRLIREKDFTFKAD